MDEMERLRRVVKQNAQTTELFGVDFLPVGGRCVDTKDIIQSCVTQPIGRKTIFGNPFRPQPGEEMQGKTLEPYREWLFAALKGEQWARDQYREATGIELPERYADAVRALEGIPFFCPGCRQRSEEDGVCHGSVLRKAVQWLNSEGGRDVH